MIKGFVEGRKSEVLVKEPQLVRTRNQRAEANADEAHQYAPLVEPLEKFLNQRQEFVIGGGIGDLLLEGLGLKIGVADLDCNRSGEFACSAQLKSKVFSHGSEDAAELANVDGVLVKGALVGNRLAFVVGFYRAQVYALGFGPNAAAVFAEGLLYKLQRQRL